MRALDHVLPGQRVVADQKGTSARRCRQDPLLVQEVFAIRRWRIHNDPRGLLLRLVFSGVAQELFCL